MSDLLLDERTTDTTGLDACFEAMADLDAAERAAEQAKQRVRDAWDQATLTVAQAQDLYWTHEHIKTNLLAAATGIPHGRLLRDLKPQPLAHLCDSCGEPKYALNRTDYKSQDRPGGICHTCEAERHEARRTSWRQDALDRQSQLQHLRSMPYQEYLRTPHWQATRVAALRRCKGRCMVCNAAARLDVHHRTYERRGSERAADVVALCRTCHGLFHANGRLAS